MNLAMNCLHILTLLVSSLWMHWIAKVFCLRRFSVTSVFYIAWVSMIHIPSIFIATNLTSAVRVNYLLSLNLAILVIPLGATAASLLARWEPSSIEGFHRRRLEAIDGLVRYQIVFWCLFLLGMFIVALYLLVTPTIPLFLLFSDAGQTNMLTIAREESFKLIGGPIAYLFAWARNSLLPLLALIAFGRWMTRKSVSRAFVLILVFGATTFYLALSIARWPIAALMLGTALLYSLLKRGSLPRVALIAGPAAFLSFPFLVTMLRGSGGWFLSIGRMSEILYLILVRRIFIVPAEVLANHYEVFPGLHGFLLGGSSHLAPLFGVKLFPLANYIALYRGASISSALSGAAFVGSAWADFGFPGVLIYSFFVGFLIQMATIFVMRSPKNMLSCVLLVLLSVASVNLISSPLTTVLVTHGGILALVVYMLFRGGLWLLRSLELGMNDVT